MEYIRSMYGSVGRLLDQSIFNFDPVQFFQHRLCCNQNENDCCSSVNQIHWKTGNIVGHQHFQMDALGIVHKRSSWIHNAAINDYCREGSECSEAAATSAQ